MRGLRDKEAIVAGAAPGNIGGATAIRGTASAKSFDITDD